MDELPRPVEAKRGASDDRLTIQRNNQWIEAGNETRITTGPRCGKGNRVGAKQRLLRAMGHDTGHAVDHAQGHQAFIGKRFDVRSERGEMM